MLRMRVYGIVAGYADQNDHDQLRSEPVFKLIAGRQPDAPELASQPTLSRFENSIDISSGLSVESSGLQKRSRRTRNVCDARHVRFSRTRARAATTKMIAERGP
jgi:hypothetical protein